MIRSKFLPMLFPAMFLVACNSGSGQQSDPSTSGLQDSLSVSLEQAWATDSLQLATPECAVYDPQTKQFYISNLNLGGDTENDGFISLLNADGSIEKLKWAEGLVAPLGIDIHEGYLYINDPTTVVKIDLKTGEEAQRIEVAGAKRLNKIDVDGQGVIYSADIEGNKIYRIQPDGTAHVFIESDVLDRPNGVMVRNSELLIASNRGGRLLSVDLESKAIDTLAEGMESADGIIALEGGHYLVSGWTGQVHFVSRDLKVQTILDTRDQKINAADIGFIPEKNLLVVPTFSTNRVVAYKLDYEK